MTHSFPTRRSSDHLGPGPPAEARHVDFPKRGRSSCGLTACTEGRGRCPFTNPGCSAAHDLVSSVRKPGKRGVCAAIFAVVFGVSAMVRSEEHTSELQSLMRISYDVFCLQKKTNE